MSAPSQSPSASENALPPDREAGAQRTSAEAGRASPGSSTAPSRPPSPEAPAGPPAAEPLLALAPVAPATVAASSSVEAPASPGAEPPPPAARLPGDATELEGPRQAAGVSSWSVPEDAGSPLLTLRVPLEGPYKAHKDALLREFERAYFTRLLERCEGNVARSAREAGLDRKHLYSILHRHKLL